MPSKWTPEAEMALLVAALSEVPQSQIPWEVVYTEVEKAMGSKPTYESAR